jgi:hypothetical protein
MSVEEALDQARRLAALGRFAEEADFLRALRAQSLPDPSIDFALALALLRLGLFAEGLPLYEARFAQPEFAPQRSLPQDKRWRGGSGAGETILLAAEQGMGDMIQFARYVPLVAARGLRVVLHTPPALQRLFATLRGAHQLAPTSAPLPPFDWQCPIASVPHALGTTVDTIPGATPYLSADPVDAARIKQALASHARPHVGFVWAAAETNPLLVHRSIPVAELEGWLAEPRATFVSLQVGPRGADAARLGSHGVLDLGRHLRDYADTAAAIAALDLVITVDTSVAHLAGALGRPVWVLLALPSDWRWAVGTARCPWYPTMRLFRQAERGDWRPVLAAASAALAAGAV